MSARRISFALVLTVFVCLCPPVASAAAAPDAQTLKARLQQEQSNAAARRASLQRLTSEERRLNTGLAAAEKRILQLERGIEDQQAKLADLAQSDAGAKAEYDKLAADVAATEKTMNGLLSLLWEISVKRISVGGREMADWDVTEREHIWSRELFSELEKYRARLREQETKLAAVLGRRQKIADSINQSLSVVNTEKETLLRERLAYNRKLEDLRDKKKDVEEELQDILKLVGDLNFQIEKATAQAPPPPPAASSGGAKGSGDAKSSGDAKKPGGAKGSPESAGSSGSATAGSIAAAGATNIEGLKGRLIRPVQGSVKLGYDPSGDPPRRGLGFSSKEGQKVVAVASGKVVHNDVLRGFGRVLILQHGSDYYTLYAFLGDCPLSVGRQVAAGAVVGSVGWYPAISGYGVYFEMRVKQKPTNPTPWFGS